MEQNAQNRGYRVAVSRSSTPRPFGQYTYSREMQEALKRVQELRPARSYSDKFKGAKNV